MRRLHLLSAVVLLLALSVSAFGISVDKSSDPSMIGGTPLQPQFSELDEAYVCLVQDFASFWGNSDQEVLDLMAPEVTYDLINSNMITSTDLSMYTFVLIAGNQDMTFNQNVLDAMADLEAYVDDGGWLQFHMGTNTHTPHMTLWDGTSYIYEDQDDFNYMGPDGDGHPILDGVVEPYQGDAANHGYLTPVPDEAAIIVVTTAGNPTLAEYDYGNGHVVVTTMTMEFLWEWAQYHDNAGQILYNSIDYCANRPPSGPVQIEINPVNGPVVIPPGSSFQFNVHVTSEYPPTVTAILWTEVELPNGQVFGPLASGQLAISNGMDWTSPNFTQNISFAAPEGQYKYYIYAGLNMQNPQIDDYFRFDVQANAAGDAGSGDWTLEGFDKLESGKIADEASSLPAEFELMPVYPNPFNPTANVSVALPDASELMVAVFNVMGQQVATLASGQYSAGVHNFTLDGSAFSSGAYFIQATAGAESALQKVLLMK